MAAVLCCSVALAAPEIPDRPTAEQMASLMTSNTMFAQAYNQQEPFVADDKTSVGLCNFADKARLEGWNYVYGGKGQRMTPGLLSAIVASNLNDARSPYLRDGYIASTLQQVGNRATDCSGLVMNYMWWAGDASDPIRALCPSIGNYNANAMLEVATERGPISTIPEIPGLLVHSNGHVGIYVGNGEVIEARGVRYGVTKTALAERSWKYWSKSPWIDYAVSGIYDLSGRWVFLDNGEDIGQDRWVAKFVYGDASAGSAYVPSFDPSATFGSSLPAVYDADAIVSGQSEMLLVDRILASIDSIPYDPRYGYLFEGHWYVILVDDYGLPEAILNDPAETDEPAADPLTLEAPQDDAASDEAQTAEAAEQPEPDNFEPAVAYAEGPVVETAPDPVTLMPDPVAEEPAEEPEPEQPPAAEEEAETFVEGDITDDAA